MLSLLIGLLKFKSFRIFYLCFFIVVSFIFFLPRDLWSTPPTEISGIELVHGNHLQIDLKKPKRATVVVFLSSRCPCSASHHSVLNQIYREFNSVGIQFIGVHSNANEDLEEAQQFFKNAGISFPVVQDTRASIADRFQAFKTPHVFIVSPTQEILFQGGVDNSKLAEKATRFYLRDALQAITEGKKPVENEVRVLGCEIKRPN